jgi:hypothetical protein
VRWTRWTCSVRGQGVQKQGLLSGLLPSRMMGLPLSPERPPRGCTNFIWHFPRLFQALPKRHSRLPLALSICGKSSRTQSILTKTCRRRWQKSFRVLSHGSVSQFSPHSNVTDESFTEHAYEHSPQHAPVFGSPSIAWEQCIIEGHPTHPVSHL